MKTIIILFLLLAILRINYCQNSIHKTSAIYLSSNFSSNIQKTTFPINLKLKFKKGDKFPDNFPLQLGGEYGTGFRNNKYGKTKFNFWQAFVDINLSKNNIFLKLEYGEMHNIENKEEIYHYGSIGINFRVFKSNKHKIFIHIGSGIQLIPFIIVSSKYLYSINKYIGLTAGPRFMYSTSEGDFYAAMLFGIQFFTN